MPIRSATTIVLTLALIVGAAIAPRAAGQAPLPPEKNPPGDIPDTQVFVLHQSPLGFTLKVPEGWARRVTADGVSFTSAYDGVAVSVSSAPAAPTVASVRREQAVALRRLPSAVRIAKISEVRLPAGRAVLISYSSNSEPNPVTGKAIRLENEQYLLWKNGRLATLTLYAPYGSDNVDQWRLMSRSFRWR
jgi:hypothetical protein